MTIEELMKDEFKAGKEEGKVEDILSFLIDMAPVSENLKTRILAVKDTEILNELLKKAAKAASIEEFESYLEQKNL